MFLEIITPDEKVYEGEVVSATFPGSEGSFQVLNDHAAMVSPLGTGDIAYKYMDHDKPKDVIIRVSGGVVEIHNNKILVLAESLVD